MRVESTGSKISHNTPPVNFVSGGPLGLDDKLGLVWNLRLAKSVVIFPNQTGIGLENRTQFFSVTFPNQTGFGLEKDTE